MPKRTMKMKDVDSIYAMLDAGVSYEDASESTGFSATTIKRMHSTLRKYGREQREVSAVRTGRYYVSQRKSEARSRPNQVAMEKVGL